MRWLECKIPPPLVMLVCGLIMKFGALTTFYIELPLNMSRVFSVVFLLAAGHFIFSSFFKFRRANTAITPLRPQDAEKLVTHGTYSMSRNPMYVGMYFVLLAYAFYLSNILSFAFSLLFIAYIHRFQIIPEQRALKKNFGEEYDNYCSRVRPWL